MVVVAIDRSGNFTDAAMWLVAVRYEFDQEHRALEMSQADFQFYMKKCNFVNYREKISAAWIYECLRPIIQTGDTIEIDKDFLGSHADYVKKCLKRLLNKFKNSDHSIEFYSMRTKEGKKHIKRADKKSKKARHKELRNPSVKKCPDLSTLLDALKI